MTHRGPDKTDRKLAVSFKHAGAGTRKCLKCEKEFHSSGIGNRLCSKCRQVNRSVHYMPSLH